MIRGSTEPNRPLRPRRDASRLTAPLFLCGCLVSLPPGAAQAATAPWADAVRTLAAAEAAVSPQPIEATHSEPRDDAYPIADLDPRTDGTANGAVAIVASTPRFVLARVELARGDWRLWASDGTVEGTVELARLPSRSVSSLGVVGVHLFFAVSPKYGRWQLWATDGTPAGTAQLAATWGVPLVLGVAPDGRAVLAIKSFRGRQSRLWLSDGSTAGTAPLGKVAASSPAATVGGLVYFTGDGPRTGHELWVTDGTVAGTHLVADVRRGRESAMASSLTTVGDTLVFFAAAQPGNRELWRTDGTAAGTTLVRELVDGPRGLAEAPPIHTLPGLGFGLFASKGTLWRTDGSASGTYALASGADETAEIAVPLLPLPGALFFGWSDAELGPQPWLTDGTAAGTRRVLDACQGSCPIYRGGAAPLGPQILFLSLRQRHLTLWSSDGRAEGTRQVLELTKYDTLDPTPPEITVTPRVAFFTYYDAAKASRQLWRTRGTAASTVALAAPGLPAIIFPPSLVAVEDRLLFAASDPMHGTELWVSRGTATTTGMLRDLDDRAVGRGSYPRGFVQLANGTVFAAGDGTDHGSLWRVGAAAAGPVERLSDATPGSFQLAAATPTRAYYTWAGKDRTVGVWATDGTPGGTAQVWAGASPKPTVASLGDHQALILGDGVWLSDGTTAGTVAVASSLGASDWVAASVGDPSAPDRVVFHSASGDAAVAGIWTSDGTTAGTHLLSAEATNPRCLTRFGDSALFVAGTPGGGEQLWFTDASNAEQTQPITAFDRIATCDAMDLTAPDAHLAFFTPDSEALWVVDGTSVRRVFGRSGRGVFGIHAGLAGVVFSDSSFLWTSDGTTEGTRSVPTAGHFLGPVASAADGKLYLVDYRDFIVTDGHTTRRIHLPLPDSQDNIRAVAAAGNGVVIATRETLWTSDGTERGTFRRAWLPSVLLVQTVGEIYPASRTVFFQAWQEELGKEPWAIDLP